MTGISQKSKDRMRLTHYVDNFLGYRYGQFVWFAFWIPSLVTLLCDDSMGHDRDFLTQATLMSSLTLLYYSYHQDKGSPASTPGIHAIYGELLARWLLFAHHYPSNVVNSTPIGVMNWIQIICMSVFTLGKLPAGIYTVWNHEHYVDMVRTMKDSDSKIY